MTNTLHWTVPVDHPAFAGHFPGTPILPGVVLLDQAVHNIAAAIKKSQAVYEIRSVKFLSPAVAGDKLDIQYAATGANGIRFDILAGTRRIASGSIVWPAGEPTP